MLDLRHSSNISHVPLVADFYSFWYIFLAPGLDQALGNIHLSQCKGMIHLSKCKYLL